MFNETASRRSMWTRMVAGTALLLLGACSPASSDLPPSSAQVPTPQLENAATLSRVRLMTRQQYANMITDIFGGTIRVSSPLPPMRRTDGLLASGAAIASITSGQMIQLQRAAAAIAAQVVDAGNVERQIPANRDFLIPCKPKSETAPDDACTTAFLRTTGRLLLRRPMEEAKIAEYVEKAHAAAALTKDFYTGLSGVLEGLLVNPQVLLIADVVEKGPKHPERARLDSYSLASRLSFFLWNSVPDEALLDAARNGQLLTPAGRARIVDRMLASPRLENGVRAFFDDMFAFDDFDNLSKDTAVYPAVTGATLKDAREQTLRTVVDHLITRNGDYRTLFTTKHTFMSPTLAAIYKVPAGPGWSSYTFAPDSPRAGILTHISFLAVHAHPGRSSATLRGKALRELLLCQRVPPPPANVDFSAIEDPRGSHRTARDRVNAHLENPVCAGCHKITDPMGLALENFDGAGQYRLTENGALIDASGTLDGTSFTDVAGLGQALRNHKSLPSCLVRRVYSYGSGGPLAKADDEEVRYFTSAFAESGYRLPALMRAIALSEAFSNVIEAPPPAATRSAALRLNLRRD